MHDCLTCPSAYGYLFFYMDYIKYYGFWITLLKLTEAAVIAFYFYGKELNMINVELIINPISSL